MEQIPCGSTKDVILLHVEFHLRDEDVEPAVTIGVQKLQRMQSAEVALPVNEYVSRPRETAVRRVQRYEACVTEVVPKNRTVC